MQEWTKMAAEEVKGMVRSQMHLTVAANRVYRWTGCEV